VAHFAPFPIKGTYRTRAKSRPHGMSWHPGYDAPNGLA
jgi:hypothetical protein